MNTKQEPTSAELIAIYLAIKFSHHDFYTLKQAKALALAIRECLGMEFEIHKYTYADIMRNRVTYRLKRVTVPK